MRKNSKNEEKVTCTFKQCKVDHNEVNIECKQFNFKNALQGSFN